MARRKKPENESIEEAETRKLFETISNHADRSEKTAWKRKKQNLEQLILELNPLQEQILSLIEKKQPILDDIQNIRNVMVEECIHPYEYLVKKDGYIECKFCNKRIIING